MNFENIKNHSITYRQGANDTEIVEAHGITMVDQNGNQILCFNDISNVLGFHHPTFDEQVTKLIVNNHLAHLGNVSKQQEIMIKNLMESTHHHFSKSFVAASGGEVVDWSIKIARRVTQKDRIISYNQSLHGRSFAGAYLSGLPGRKTNFGSGLSNVSFIDYPTDEDLSVIEYEDVAAIIIEPYQAVAGMRHPTKAYMKWLREYTKENHIILIFDEIQTGFGKTGTMYAYEQFDIVPDILLLGKGMSNGFGLGALLMNEECGEAMKHGEMAGGSADNDFMCGVVNTVFDIYKEEKIVEHVSKLGIMIHEAFEQIKQQFHKDWKINGNGLFTSLELDENIGLTVFQKCKEKGILFYGGKNRIGIRSPLVVTDKEMEYALHILKESIEEVLIETSNS